MNEKRIKTDEIFFLHLIQLIYYYSFYFDTSRIWYMLKHQEKKVSGRNYVCVYRIAKIDYYRYYSILKKLVQDRIKTHKKGWRLKLHILYEEMLYLFLFVKLLRRRNSDGCWFILFKLKICWKIIANSW